MKKNPLILKAHQTLNRINIQNHIEIHHNNTAEKSMIKILRAAGEKSHFIPKQI